MKDTLIELSDFAIDIPLRYQTFQEIKNKELDEYLKELKSMKNDDINRLTAKL